MPARQPFPQPGQQMPQQMNQITSGYGPGSSFTEVRPTGQNPTDYLGALLAREKGAFDYGTPVRTGGGGAKGKASKLHQGKANPNSAAMQTLEFQALRDRLNNEAYREQVARQGAPKKYVSGFNMGTFLTEDPLNYNAIQKEMYGVQGSQQIGGFGPGAAPSDMMPTAGRVGGPDMVGVGSTSGYDDLSPLDQARYALAVRRMGGK